MKFLIAISVLSMLHFHAFPQDVANDMELAAQSLDGHYQSSDPSRGFMIHKDQPGMILYNPVAWLLAGGMYVYQNVISSQFSATCFHSPSCSNFSRQLILEYGIIKGVFLTADRLTRCNRIARTDVPPWLINPEDQKLHEPVEAYKSQSCSH